MQFIQAAIRTGVQVVVAWFATRGIEVDAAALEVVVLGIGTGVVTLVLNYLESKFPWLARVVSLGTAKNGPSY